MPNDFKIIVTLPLRQARHPIFYDSTRMNLVFIFETKISMSLSFTLVLDELQYINHFGVLKRKKEKETLVNL